MELKLPVDFGRTAISQEVEEGCGGGGWRGKEGGKWKRSAIFLLILLLIYSISTSPHSEVSKKICPRCWKLEMRLSENVILLLLLFLHVSPISCLFLPTDVSQTHFCVGEKAGCGERQQPSERPKERNNHSENYWLFLCSSPALSGSLN